MSWSRQKHQIFYLKTFKVREKNSDHTLEIVKNDFENSSPAQNCKLFNGVAVGRTLTLILVSKCPTISRTFLDSLYQASLLLPQRI